MNDWEIKFVQYFNKLGGKKTDLFLGFINSIRFLVVFWSVLVVVAIVRHPEIAVPFFLAVALVALMHFVITEGIIKHLSTYVIAGRKRPYVAYPNLIRPIGRKFSDSSFPSSHMATTAAMVFVIANFYPSLVLPTVVFVAVIAFSRLHNGMHYPSDVLAGTILGSLYGYFTLVIMKIFFS